MKGRERERERRKGKADDGFVVDRVGADRDFVEERVVIMSFSEWESDGTGKRG